MSNPLQNAVDGATDLVSNLPVNDFALGGDNDVSMTKFVANVRKQNIAPNNAFSVELYCSELSGDPNPRIFYTAESASLGGRRFDSEELNTGGPTQRIPYNQTYSGETSVTFRVGIDFYERKLFEDWQALVYDERNDVWGYFADYTGNMVVRAFDKSNGNIYGDRYTDVYPLSIDEIGYEQGADGMALRQTITFGYRKWEPLKQSELKNPPGGIPGGVPLVNAFIGDDLSNLITGSMNLASAVNTKIQEVDQVVQDNVGFMRRAVNGDVVLAPFENVGRNLNQVLDQYSGTSFVNF